MGILFSGERGGDTIQIAGKALVCVTLLPSGATANLKSRYSWDDGVTWSSAVAVASLIGMVNPTICGPAADGRIFVFYTTSGGSLAMKWSTDLGVTWHG